MATKELTTQQEVPVNPQASEDVSFDQATIAVVQYKKTITDEAGNESTEVTTKMMSEEQAKEEEKGKKGTILFTQSVAYPKALTIKGMARLAPDEDEVVAMFNRGNKIKIDNKLRAEVTATDENGTPTFAPVEGAFDLSQFAREKTQARGMTPAERMLKMLEKELAKIKSEDEVRTFATVLNMPFELVRERWAAVTSPASA